jgi:hypothetical protein
MEVACNDYFRIWWLNFGAPGSKNDVQIYKWSKLFNMIRVGHWRLLPENRILRLYPIVVLFLIWRNLPAPAIYGFHHESGDSRGQAILWETRRRTERARESLRCAVQEIQNPASAVSLHHVEDMEDALRCCGILHNMMCAYWRSKYSGSRANQLRDEQAETDLLVLTNEGIIVRLTRRPESEAEPHAFRGAHLEVIEDSG